MATGRVLVAMSGGVDSAVAAMRLVDAGYDVVGVTLHLWDYPEEWSDRSHGRCCAPEDQYDARRTADALGFPHYTFDRRELFEQSVVRPFVDSYLAGETPSPCATCNRTVKLTELFAIANRLGALHVATGHYARIERDQTGQVYLARGRDYTKDQSYFLYATPEEQLQRLIFPLGTSEKMDVRAEAIARRIPGAHKGESQELCFVGAGAHAYASFVEGRAEGRVRPGPIVDGEGNIVGNHNGIHRFTIGQRKGIGVALGKPAFVSEIDAQTATVQLRSDATALETDQAEVGEVVWAPGIAVRPGGSKKLSARIRYRHEAIEAELVMNEEQRALLAFARPVRAVTRGQVAVFYDGDRVLGGGKITRAISSSVSSAFQLSEQSAVSSSV